MESRKSELFFSIPACEFIEDESKFVSDYSDADDALKSLQRKYQKYTSMHTQLQQSRLHLQTRLPELRRTLEMIDRLVASPTMTTHFEVTSGMYAKAQISEKATGVYLWLGANVMIEYSFDEAKQLMNKNVSTAEISLQALQGDADFVKEQMTVCEVNMARIVNYGVMLRKKQQQQTQSQTAGPSST